MPTKLLTQANGCQLVIVDMQARLASAMPEVAMQAVLKNHTILLQAMQWLNIPTLISEQYPKGLGNTMPELLAHIAKPIVVEKMTFSCMAAPSFVRQLTSDKPQIILTGMESHICVLQTALDMVAAGKQVFVVEDAVISRNPENKQNAMHRLRQAGVIVSNTESVLFELLGKAEGDVFKKIAQLIR